MGSLSRQHISLSRQQIIAYVHEKIQPAIVEDLINYVKEKNILLWGSVQPREFISDMVVLTLYKDFYAFGVNKLIDSVALGYVISYNSFWENSHRIRLALKEWAEVEIQPGNQAEWRAHARNCNLKGEVSDTNLWMDSADIQIAGKRTCSRKSPDWSYKLNAPGKRYMVIVDGRGKVRKVWGGYTPKLYDGDFLEVHKEEISQMFHKAVVIADNHFTKGKKIFRNLKFHTNYRTSRKKELTVEERIHSEDFVNAEVAQTKKKYNEDHRRARARVETPFGFIKTKFSCLENAWQESTEQLDCVVYLGLALFSKRHTVVA